ncbi:NDP-hexose 2,3-dehydratase family protein [Actinokineospora sp. PR83]|uniref:NDP-hexose 2,3-dehydratase family protein n=1 Tax=Actinokineospora sp. PR83 TaxID=2884908 RepID=UPI001F21E013|nr:NDP-hexose 2,3-dehydratase family protein [Actinokineospora sp. PR83]MCG8918356.1 NDP-hexose 2,3-dehydratase family protein [Actinokineospora sp. PR83]
MRLPGSTTTPAEHGLAERLAASGLVRDGSTADALRWFEDLRSRSYTEVEQVALEDLVGWSTHPVTGDIVHDSGRFFVVEGLDVRIPGGPVPHWRQPIINQPEIGVLGILAKEFDGVLHLLMQAKVEPGNCNGLQLSPTVQATRSNYTGAHRGRGVPYLDYFMDTAPHSVLADVRQSEQGSWFHQKRNRNMVVEVRGDVPVLDGFRWFTLGQVHELLAADDLVNMDARTVLSCLPFTGRGVRRSIAAGDDWFRDALLRSCVAEEGSRHPDDEVLSWITQARSATDVHTRRIPLSDVDGWVRVDGRIRHETGRFFDVMGVRVVARGREVDSWTQPMIEAPGEGVVAFVVRRIGGVLHALMHGRVEPGYIDVVELAPTVQCKPENYSVLDPRARPPFLDLVLAAAPDRIRFDAVLSEEGGRFYRTRNRYLVVEVDPAEELAHPDFRWVTLDQLAGLLRHSHYLNVQARSLVACLHSLVCAPIPAPEART